MQKQEIYNYKKIMQNKLDKSAYETENIGIDIITAFFHYYDIPLHEKNKLVLIFEEYNFDYHNSYSKENTLLKIWGTILNSNDSDEYIKFKDGNFEEDDFIKFINFIDCKYHGVLHSKLTMKNGGIPKSNNIRYSQKGIGNGEYANTLYNAYKSFCNED